MPALVLKSRLKKIKTSTKSIFSKFPGETVDDVVRTTATVARDSLTATPIAGGACGGLVSVLDHRKRVKDVKKNARLLIDRAIALSSAVDTDQNTSAACTIAAQAVKNLCLEIQLRVTPLTQAKWTSRLLHLHQNEDLIKDYHCRLDQAFQSFLVATTVKTGHDISKIQGSLIASTLQTDHNISEIKKQVNALYILSVSTVLF